MTSKLQQLVRDLTKTVAKNEAQDITFKHDRIASVAGKYGRSPVEPGKREKK